MLETTSAGMPIQVDDLDRDWLLFLAEDAEVQARQSERRLLRYALAWCRLNPATEETGTATWADLGPEALRCDETIGGDGTPAVAAFAAEELGAALSISTAAALQLMADALNLHHRLPLIWGRVEALDLQPWRARRIASATARLSREAAAYVDRALVGRIDSCGMITIDRAIADAVARFEPDSVPDAEARAKARWGVRLQHTPVGAAGDWAGTSQLDATGDTLDLTRFHDLVCAVAEQLRADGDDDDLEVRKARAIGIIADRAQGIDSASRAGAKTRLYLHVRATDLADPSATGAAERLGPVTIARIREWLAGSRATIVPLVDLNRTDAVDRHDPPAWLRELVVLRDRHCVFPWCHRDSRGCDLDHIEPWRDPAEGGPPGQTRPDNLAPLCRRHHRAKTAGRWRYRSTPDGTYLWTAPSKRTYAVTTSGTLALG